jgi:hypothetical protein
VKSTGAEKVTAHLVCAVELPETKTEIPFREDKGDARGNLTTVATINGVVAQALGAGS